MSLTSKDYEEIRSRPRRWWAPVLIAPGRMLRPLMRIGFIRRRLARTMGGRFGAIFNCQKRGEHAKAAALAIDALKAYRHGTRGLMGDMTDFHWWQFMHYGVQSLERCDDTQLWDEALALAEDGIEPFEGCFVAYSFLGFSRRAYRQGDFDRALALARRAAAADPTWAEPEVLLGWYALALGSGDALEHLVRALETDGRILFRVVKDPLFRRHPQILARLKALAGERGVFVSDEPDAEDGETAED